MGCVDAMGAADEGGVLREANSQMPASAPQHANANKTMCQGSMMGSFSI